MQIEILLIVGAVLCIMMVLDAFYKKIPSIIPTMTIFMLLVVIIHTTPIKVVYGLLGAVLGLFLWELYYIGGVADIKAIVLISLIIPNLTSFFVFMILFAFTGFIYQFSIQKVMKKKKGEQIPFIPVFFVVFLILLLGGFL